MRRWMWAVLALAAAGGAAAWWHGVPGMSPAVAAKPIPAAIPVVVAAAVPKDVPVYATGIGAAQAYNSVTVKVRVDGELQKVLFKEGQDVKAGEVLAEIDPRTYQAALAQAKATKAKDEAQLANAKLDLDRYASLVEKNATSRQTLDTQKALVAQYEAAVQGDQAAIDNATVQLGYTTIRAPIDGRTGVRQVDQGNIVHATDTTGLVVISQLKPMSVIFALPQERLEEVAAALARGPVEVIAYKRDGVTEVGEGKVELIDNTINADTGTLRLKATFPNDNLTLWPGAFVNVKVLVNTLKDEITIPSRAVQRGPTGPYVFVIGADNVAQKRDIAVVSMAGETAVIKSGLKPGEQVVIDGQSRLTPGAKVAVRSGKTDGGAVPAASIETGEKGA